MNGYPKSIKFTIISKLSWKWPWTGNACRSRIIHLLAKLTGDGYTPKGVQTLTALSSPLTKFIVLSLHCIIFFFRYGRERLEKDVAKLREMNRKLREECVLQVADNSLLKGEFK